MEKAASFQSATGKSCTSEQVSLIREQISKLQAYQELTTALGRLPNCPLKDFVKTQLDDLVSFPKQESTASSKIPTEQLRSTISSATGEVLRKYASDGLTINEVATQVAILVIKDINRTFPNILSSILENDKRSPESPQ